MCDHLKRKQVRELIGENPHQSAVLYETSDVPACSLLNAQCACGEALSYNDLFDVDAALALIREFPREEGVTAVFFHHGNPCGLAVAERAAAAYRMAKEACDMTSIIEGMLVINDVIDEPIAKMIDELYLHAVVAPDVTDAALAILRSQPQLTVLKHPDMMSPVPARCKEVKSIVGGLLIQDYNDSLVEELKTITAVQPDEDTMRQLQIAWRVVKHTKTNAMVLVKENATVGIGPGLNNRIWSTEQAILRAGERAAGSVLASDAIIPLCESVELAGKAGVKAIIEPGGWYKEEENIAVAEKYGIAMVTTGVNQFKH